MAPRPTPGRRNTRRLVQCPCCGRGDLVKSLLEREIAHPGGVYDQIVWSPGKGNIQNEIRSAQDEEVTAELVKRAKAFLKAMGEL